MLGAKDQAGGRYSAGIRSAVGAARKDGVRVALEPHTAAMSEVGRCHGHSACCMCSCIHMPECAHSHIPSRSHQVAVVVQAYANARVVVVPSRRAEAFGRVLLEGLAARRLVVVFHHGAAGEVASKIWEEGCRWQGDGGATDCYDEARCWGRVAAVRPGVLLMGAVFLVGPCDVKGLASAIEAAIAMPSAEYSWRTRRAAVAVRACFAMDTFTERTLAVYNELVCDFP
jgi:glycosyltransferase involved in cell wall biosynthesis